MLFGRIGRTYSPVTGEEVRKQSVEDIIAAAGALPEGTRIAIAAPVNPPAGRDFATQLEIYQKEGFSTCRS
jgi:excinuclease ABC subunit A